MGRNLHYSIIAEGVETPEHAAFLKKNKCFAGQGYLFSKPLPAAELEAVLFAENVRKPKYLGNLAVVGRA